LSQVAQAAQAEVNPLVVVQAACSQARWKSVASCRLQSARAVVLAVVAATHPLTKS
jgi:hypothetical protein